MPSDRAYDDMDTLAAGVLDSGQLNDNDDDLAGFDASRFPASSRAIALRIWALEAGRDHARLQAILHKRAGIRIPLATLRRWAITDEWPQKARELHQTFINTSRSATDSTLAFGAPKAAGFLVGLLEDPDANVNAKVKAAQTILALAGYVPLPPGASAINYHMHVNTSDLANVEDTELQAMAMQYANGNDAIAPPIETTYTEARLSGQLNRPDTTHRAPTPNITDY